jgi:ABC-type molybdenum transport system ATPase subunit/photorepair protein PhrA
MLPGMNAIQGIRHRMDGSEIGPLFSGEGLSLDLGGREVLTNISCSVNAGEVLGIIGPNGAGKTSLLEILSGRYAPKSGDVFFKGERITERSLFERARLGLGRTYQTPLVADELTVGETFKAARQAYKPYLTRLDAEYGAALVNFVSPEDKPSAQLKTFERRKLLLACLLMRHPKVLLHAVQGNEYRHRHRRTPDRAAGYGGGSCHGHGCRRGDCPRRSRRSDQKSGRARGLFRARGMSARRRERVCPRF